MRPDPNYPRWMYHRSLEAVMIHSPEEEAALGREWARRPWAALPREEKPEPVPEPEDEPQPDPEPKEPQEPVEEPAAPAAPPVKPKRGRPAAHKPPHKTTAHKRG